MISRLVPCLVALGCLSTPATAQRSVDTLYATVHGHRVAFFVGGDASAPVVILEPGGGSHRAWGGFASRLAEFARVVAYDRPGYGLSEPCPHVRSASVIAGELHEALEILDVRGPFILGGWSVGGSYSRVYGARYPEQVAGVVLIDPAPDGFYDRAAREHPESWKAMLEEQEHYVATREEGHRAEWAAWDTTLAEARASDAGLRAPIILLTATRAEDEFQPIWMDEHRKWAGRMPNVHRHLLVENAGHAIFRDQPEVVIRAFRELVTPEGSPSGG